MGTEGRKGGRNEEEKRRREGMGREERKKGERKEVRESLMRKVTFT